MRSLHWLGGALAVIRSWPEAVRQRVGYELFRVQKGLRPTDSRRLRGTAPGVFEIRVHHTREHRVAYTPDVERVFVLHAWVKKSRSTEKKTLDLIRQRARLIDEF